MIVFACSNCGKQIRAKDEAGGKRAKCPGCSMVITIPATISEDRPVVENRKPPVASNASAVSSNTQPLPGSADTAFPEIDTKAPRTQTGASSGRSPSPGIGDVSSRVAQLSKVKLDGPIRWIVRKELKKVPELLSNGEELVNLAQGFYDGKNGLVALTDRRVLFIEEGMFRSRLEDFSFDRISSVQTEKGFAHGKLVVFVSGNKAILEKISPKERAIEIGDMIRDKINAPKSTPSPGSGSSPDPVAQLKQLAELRDAGVLDNDEFEAKKAKLLSQI